MKRKEFKTRRKPGACSKPSLWATMPVMAIIAWDGGGFQVSAFGSCGVWKLPVVEADGLDLTEETTSSPCPKVGRQSTQIQNPESTTANASTRHQTPS